MILLDNCRTNSQHRTARSPTPLHTTKQQRSPIIQGTVLLPGESTRRPAGHHTPGRGSATERQLRDLLYQQVLHRPPAGAIFVPALGDPSSPHPNAGIEPARPKPPHPNDRNRSRGAPLKNAPSIACSGRCSVWVYRWLTYQKPRFPCSLPPLTCPLASRRGDVDPGGTPRRHRRGHWHEPIAAVRVFAP